MRYYRSILASVVMSIHISTPALAKSECYQTGTQVPANQYYVNSPFDGPFFTADAGSGHVHFITETPSYKKNITMTPSVWFRAKPPISYGSYLLRFEFRTANVTSMIGKEPTIIIERSRTGDVRSRRDYAPPATPNGQVSKVQSLTFRMRWDKTEIIEFLSTRIVWLERLCWADKASDFPPILRLEDVGLGSLSGVDTLRTEK